MRCNVCRRRVNFNKLYWTKRNVWDRIEGKVVACFYVCHRHEKIMLKIEIENIEGINVKVYNIIC